MSADHFVTFDFERDSTFSPPRLTCHAPATAECHAFYDCGCEVYYNPSVVAGLPVHEDSEGEQHVGYYDATRCNLKDWAENSEECLRGEVTFAVTAEWIDDEYYLFHAVPQKDETPRLIEVTP